MSSAVVRMRTMSTKQLKDGRLKLRNRESTLFKSNLGVALLWRSLGKSLSTFTGSTRLERENVDFWAKKISQRVSLMWRWWSSLGEKNGEKQEASVIRWRWKWKLRRRVWGRRAGWQEVCELSQVQLSSPSCDPSSEDRSQPLFSGEEETLQTHHD